MIKFNIGCGRNVLEGWVNVDRCELPGVDITHDLEDCRYGCLPVEPNTVDEFLLSHVIEHVNDSLGLMQELHRIAKPGALATIRTPFGSSDDAWEDPTHVRAYFPNSFGYFSQPFYWRVSTKVDKAEASSQSEGLQSDALRQSTLSSSLPPQMAREWTNRIYSASSAEDLGKQGEVLEGRLYPHIRESGDDSSLSSLCDFVNGYGYYGDWRVKKIQLLVESACDMVMIRMARNVVKEMVAMLEAVKPIREPKRELQEATMVEIVVTG